MSKHKKELTEFEVFLELLKKEKEKHGPDKDLTIGHMYQIASSAHRIYNNYQTIEILRENEEYWKTRRAIDNIVSREIIQIKV